MESDIIGGKEIKPHSRPYIVSVQVNKAHVCGGMLIRKNYVLTAAHCVSNIKFPGKNKLEVVLGAHNISQKEREQQRIQVKKYIKHPFYNPKTSQNDTMLLKLKSEAKLNEYVKVIDLPKKNEKINALKNCSIAGWGKKKQNGAASNVLHEVTLKLQFSFECKKIWQQFFDSQSMICTVSDGKKAFCQGDSGSPLICKNAALGLAAYTFDGNCLNQKYPEVYMKIPYYVQWIEDVINKK
ncbi:granzyme B-like [Trichomycterus rosablanca]|uniref:granzyme B-like n=1 Tax=Trichomycterus rosablanca TaxID=2290929 RepID=UPI002F35CB6D